jgi:hypothetical protein
VGCRVGYRPFWGERWRAYEGVVVVVVVVDVVVVFDIAEIVVVVDHLFHLLPQTKTEGH